MNQENLNCWFPIPKESDFSIYNLPWGIFSTRGGKTRVGMALGDHIVDMEVVADAGLFNEYSIHPTIWESETLNALIQLGKPATSALRLKIQHELCNEQSHLKSLRNVFVDQKEASMKMPIYVRDYTDFYSSEEHATNVGKMFRDPENALLPNWKHLPVGYHGRASSIVVSGTSIVRPCGQTKSEGANPVFGPCRLLDFELEVGFVVGKVNPLGVPVPVRQAEDHIFGLVLFNDWSARDIQKWEYVPLGPFLGKSFASTISPWVVPLEALEPFRVSGPTQNPQPLPYLLSDEPQNFDISLEVSLRSPLDYEEAICHSNFKFLYWSMAQQLAHHTSNGCNLSIGDMLASGTISGKERSSFGSMLELSWGGKNPILLKNGEKRNFLEDGDEIILKGYAGTGNKKVGFGEARGKIIPAIC